MINAPEERRVTQGEQEQRVLASLRVLGSPLDQYLFLVALAELEQGLIYPTISRLREVSLQVADTVGPTAWSGRE